MTIFQLPKNTEVRKVIPKNAFDAYTNTKQKKAFSDKVLRMTWLDKIAFENVHLQGNDVQKIQVFKIVLKEKATIKDLLSIIENPFRTTLSFGLNFRVGILAFI